MRKNGKCTSIFMWLRAPDSTVPAFVFLDSHVGWAEYQRCFQNNAVARQRGQECSPALFQINPVYHIKIIVHGNKKHDMFLMTFIFNFMFQSCNSKANFDTEYQIKLEAVTNHMILHKTI